MFKSLQNARTNLRAVGSASSHTSNGDAAAMGEQVSEFSQAAVTPARGLFAAKKSRRRLDVEQNGAPAYAEGVDGREPPFNSEQCDWLGDVVEESVVG